MKTNNLLFESETAEKVTAKIALVAVEKALYSFDRLWSYTIPHELEREICTGIRVLVPFGRGARKIAGMVFAIEVREVDPATTKPICEILDNEAFLNAEMLSLAVWLKENTFCTYYNAVRCILPPILRNSGSLGNSGGGSKTEKIVTCSDSLDLSAISDNLTPKQKLVVDLLENHSASIKEVCYLCSVGAGVVNNLIKKGVLTEVIREVQDKACDYNDYSYQKRQLDDIVLTNEQSAAFNSLTALLNQSEPKCALLHGVTGSGKTSVFIKLVGEVLSRGRSALILVPEISLTPQTISIFKGYFDDFYGDSNVAVIHSGLTASNRTREYKRIRSGEARIVLGTRSAVFSPLEDIGLIVIDEEGEHTYKSERSPRYHVRDVAKQRCFRHNALLLLASATPSMESYRAAQINKYALLELNERYSGNALPDVYITDMKLENALGNKGTFSTALLEQLERNLTNGEQSLILLNRRGYHTHICCIKCGEVAMCPNCGVPLTLHRNHKSNGESLSCHYCGFLRQYDYRCDKCRSRFIKQTGTGTQRIEDELQELFPKARILRMDADTTMTKGAYERNFTAFGNHEYDIMVGTQMIAKGLDFPNVTLVGILLIDNSLYAGDYLGYERTFSLITQVVGRSGRGGKRGRAFLQTYTPEHYVLRLAAKQDYRGFYEEEAAIRQRLLFPPFCDFCVVEFCDVVEASAVEAAKIFIEIFESNHNNHNSNNAVPIRVLGPVKNGVGSINGWFRYRLVVKCRNSPNFRKIMSNSLIQAGEDRRFEHCRVSAWFDN